MAFEVGFENARLHSECLAFKLDRTENSWRVYEDNDSLLTNDSLQGFLVASFEVSRLGRVFQETCEFLWVDSDFLEELGSMFQRYSPEGLPLHTIKLTGQRFVHKKQVPIKKALMEGFIH